MTSLCNDLLRYTQLRANASPSVNHRGELLNMVSQQGITFHVAEQSLEQERASGLNGGAATGGTEKSNRDRLVLAKVVTAAGNWLTNGGADIINDTSQWFIFKARPI